MAKAQIQELLVEAKFELQQLCGEHLVAVILYDSRASGEAGPHLDLDVAFSLKHFDLLCAQINRTCEIVVRLLGEHGVSMVLLRLRNQHWHERQTHFCQNL